jgi:mxaJ protein
MSLPFRNLVFFLLLIAICGRVFGAAPLRICADPDDPPFSTGAAQGFDNRIAILLAHDLHREPVFVWTRSRRGFIREQFNKGACDILMGVPAGMKTVATSRPYYRSTYVFATPLREHLQIASFDDPHLSGRRIGLQILEEDLSPPSIPLIRTGHAAQLVGYPSFGARGGDIVRAVSTGRVGTAVVWGPIAGYFTAVMHLPLQLTPVSPAVDASGIPFTFAVAVAVHKNDVVLRDSVNSSLTRLQPQIDRILTEYHVPTLPLQENAR